MSENREQINPPRFATWLLESFCSYDFLSTARWDLDELFVRNVNSKGAFKAKSIYLKEVFSIILFLFFKGKTQYTVNKFGMVKHNILIALRSFHRYKTTFFINLFGLACGLASVLLIYLWVNDEMQMGHFDEQDSNRHYQVLINAPFSTGVETYDYTPMPLAKALEDKLPEVEKGIPVVAAPYYKGVLSFEENNLRAVPLFAGDGYFDVFRCDFTAGSKVNALSNNGIVLSSNLAASIFDEPRDAIGQTIQFSNEYATKSYVINGIFQPSDDDLMSHDILLSFDHFLNWRPENNNWQNSGPQVHLVLNENVNVDQFNTKINTFLSGYMETNEELFIQKYSDKYLYGKYENGVPVAGKIIYLRIFSLIAVFILIIACINYMNLTTAQASRRVKEIGVKKAAGVSRRTLIYQFFSESLCIAFISLLLAFGMVALLLPSFNAITGKLLTISDLLPLLLPAILITGLTGFISGIYPGLYLSRFKPALALKGNNESGSGAAWFRKGLVVFQFALSIVLTISVIVVYQQMEYLKESNLGYDQEHLITFNREGKLYEGDAEAFMDEVRKLEGVERLSYLWGELPGDVSGGSGMQWQGMDTEAPRVDFSFIEGGFEMANVLGVEFLDGRSLSRDFATDKTAVVLNESAAELTGYENPVGKPFYNGDETGEIVGVVKDFHFEGLRDEIGPFFFMYTSDGDRFMAQVRGENQAETIKQIEKLHEAFNPGYPFEFSFVDQSYQKLYLEEERISTLSKYFSVIAITISCLGLLALTAFSTQRRFKEIAIRKVLGSSNVGIMGLLSKEFIVLVFVASLIAGPIGFYLMKYWLEGFAYRIALDPVYIVWACIAMLSLAGIVILSQVSHSAKMNVSDSLKIE